MSLTSIIGIFVFIIFTLNPILFVVEHFVTEKCYPVNVIIIIIIIIWTSLQLDRQYKGFHAD